ncbi:GlxA family transcriptional regulator [Eleftheria terrae]|uniref:GlxA family transcriptional regulator n=1 Tax=Eleftheria terrae TaxID=1597781 RepID=UPI00263B208D|nr:helix-turn-helix domain-containing protein [Eleftheria terrae]WKB55421.1 helix-turn-helix domain-containing protein [Eleftheria terrae]
MHKIAVLAFDDVIAFDLATPCEVFGRAPVPARRGGYQIKVCAASDTVGAGWFSLQLRHTLDDLAEADTVIVPGLSDPSGPLPAGVLRALRQAAHRGARLVSICTGAFVLAAAGLLDGKRATTHWQVAPALARRYPAVEVLQNVLFTEDGMVYTSAGAAAGIDLCLHLVALDHGVGVAAETAKLAVVPLQRAAGQPQYVRRPRAAVEPPLQELLVWLLNHLDRDLSLDNIAAAGRLSVRTLHRRFLEETGLSPTQWLLRARVKEAQRLLEGTRLPVERVATEVGFHSATALRAHFRRHVGVPPSAYRRAGREGQTAAR